MRHPAVPDPVVGLQRSERVLGDAFLMLHWTYEHPDFPDAIAMLDERSFHSFDVRGVVRRFDFEINEAGKIQNVRAYWNPATLMAQLQG